MALLILSGAIAGGALFAKYKLEGLRGRLLETAELRTGTEIRFERITGFGLRGLRAEGVSVRRDTDAGPSVEVDVPLAYVYVDLTELLYGQVVVERVQVEGADITIRRAPTAASGTIAGLRDLGKASPPPLPPFPFRIMGTDCRVRFENLVADSSLDLRDITFDVAKLADSPSLSGTVEAQLGNDADKRLRANVRYVSMDDFDARADLQRVTADDVNVFLPASQRFVLDGAVTPSVRIEGKADGIIALSIEADVRQLLVRDQPEFLPPLTGSVDARGTYDPDTRELRIAMAQAETPSLAGTVTGTIGFAGNRPEFNLRLRSAQLPIADIFNVALEGRLDEYGELTYAVSTDAEVDLRLTGNTEKPNFELRAAMSGAEASFVPKDTRFPRSALRLGRVEATWESTTRSAKGSAVVLDGTVSKPDFGLEATGINATISLDGRRVELASLTATAKDQPIVADGWYDLEEKKGEVSVAGVVAAIEETRLGTLIRNTTLEGSVAVNAKADYADGRLNFEGDIDASQAQVAYQWYFLKPPGIGATGRITGSFVPKKSAKFEVDGHVAGSRLAATASMAHNGRKWQLRKLVAHSDQLDVVSVGKCLPLPYVITGGIARAAKYDWTRTDGKDGQDWVATIEAAVDEIAIRAEGAQSPLVCKDLKLTGEVREGKERSGHLTLHAADAVTPPLRGDKWFNPLIRDLEKYPPVDRLWSYDLRADTLAVPPWKGRDFTGHAYTSLKESGLDRFAARVDDGSIEGDYRSDRKENSYTMSARWTNVPAKYFMEHLRQPQIFSGNMNGHVQYSQDRDDPRSLAGTGQFSIQDGQFSADYLIALFERQLEGDVASLPPSLRFSKLESEVEFAGDVIKTPNILLESDAMRMEARGEFVIDGDMNYEIKVAVSPDAAERIPLMRENFNVQGHRLAQEDIELAFNLSGPTLKPVSTVSETPPIRVTLVSGALETAREALQVIDAPRKILFDLLKIGGGIVGARKQPQNADRN